MQAKFILKNMKKGNKIAVLSLLLIIAFDQFSKYLIRQNDGFYICNKGVAFGVNIPEAIFLPIWITIVVLIVLYLYKNKSDVYFVSLIIAGALSNMIDRIIFGCVTDFINLKVWPLFNVADTFIVIGAILLIVSKIKKENKK